MQRGPSSLLCTGHHRSPGLFQSCRLHVKEDEQHFPVSARSKKPQGAPWVLGLFQQLGCKPERSWDLSNFQLYAGGRRLRLKIGAHILRSISLGARATAFFPQKKKKIHGRMYFIIA